MRTVYLAGPILGQTKSGANDWREYAASVLRESHIIGISPLRCEPLVGTHYSANYEDPKFGTARAIGSKNMFDVRQCDLTLAYLPKLESARHQSFGTIIELAWARAFDKPAIVVSDDPDIFNHPVVNACAGWLLKDLDDGIEVALGILGGYTPGGKNV